MEELFINEIWPLIKLLVYVGGGLFVLSVLFVIIQFLATKKKF